MASGLGSIVGSALGGPIGGLIGGILGSLADRAIFSTGRERGPSIADLQLSTASEGSPILYLLGPDNRIPCTIIWKSALTTTTQEHGGCGGGGAGASVDNYTVNVCLALCEGPIEQVEQLYANGRLIYDATPTVAIESTQISLDARVHTWTTLPLSDEVWVTLSAPSGGPDLTELRNGTVVTVAGFTHGPNNFEQVVIGTGIDATDNSTFANFYWTEPSDSDPSVLPADEAAGDTVTIDQDAPAFSTADMAGITIYLGSATDAIDSTMESIMGTGEVPGYRGVAHVVIDDLQLGSFPSMPVFNAVVRATADPTSRATAIGNLCARAGLTSAQYDADAVAGNLRGITIQPPGNVVDVLAPMMVAHDLRAQEDQGVIKFKDYGDMAPVTLREAAFAAHEPGSDTPRTVQWKVGEDPPTEVNVRHIDPSNKYQLGSQRARWRSTVDRFRDSSLELDMPEVLTAVEARTIAERVRLTLAQNRIEATLQLPPNVGMILLEGDLIEFEENGETHLVTVKKVQTGANWITVVTGVREEDSAHTISISDADGATTTDPTVYYPIPLLITGTDIAPLNDIHATTAGYYWSAATLDYSALHTGGALYVSTDSGTSYTFTDLVPFESPMGYATSVLAAGVTNVWDRDNTVDVRVLHGALTSASEAAVLTGTNWMFLGGEVIGFATATLIGANEYRLSDLLRGLRGTENFVGAHEDAESWTLITSVPVGNFNPAPLSSVDDSWLLKGVPNGGDVDDGVVSSLPLTGGTIMPFAPYDVAGIRDASDNLALSWKARTRALVGIWTETDVPLLEEYEEYEVDVLNGSSTVVRTITVETATATSYTAAQQTSDGLTPGDPVELRVYQISSRGIGRGREAVATV